MKSTLSKTIGAAALTISMLAVFTQVWVSAQDNDNESLRSRNEQGLVGSWNLVVSLRDCETGTVLFSFPAMSTYNQGGTTQQIAIPPPGITALPGHGIWSHQTGQRYSGAFQAFGLNPDGTLASRLIVRSAIRLGRGGDSYTSTDTAQVLSANGDLLSRACSTTSATRFE